MSGLVDVAVELFGDTAPRSFIESEYAKTDKLSKEFQDWVQKTASHHSTERASMRKELQQIWDRINIVYPVDTRRKPRLLGRTSPFTKIFDVFVEDNQLNFFIEEFINTVKLGEFFTTIREINQCKEALHDPLIPRLAWHIVHCTVTILLYNEIALYHYCRIKAIVFLLRKTYTKTRIMYNTVIETMMKTICAAFIFQQGVGITDDEIAELGIFTVVDELMCQEKQKYERNLWDYDIFRKTEKKKTPEMRVFMNIIEEFDRGDTQYLEWILTGNIRKIKAGLAMEQWGDHFDAPESDDEMQETELVVNVTRMIDEELAKLNDKNPKDPPAWMYKSRRDNLEKSALIKLVSSDH